MEWISRLGGGGAEGRRGWISSPPMIRGSGRNLSRALTKVRLGPIGVCGLQRALLPARGLSSRLGVRKKRLGRAGRTPGSPAIRNRRVKGRGGSMGSSAARIAGAGNAEATSDRAGAAPRSRKVELAGRFASKWAEQWEPQRRRMTGGVEAAQRSHPNVVLSGRPSS